MTGRPRGKGPEGLGRQAGRLVQSHGNAGPVPDGPAPSPPDTAYPGRATMVLRGGPARPDAGTARSAPVHRAAVPSHRMPACHRTAQAARNHLSGHEPRMHHHPGSERNPRSSHPAGSRFGPAAGPSGGSAGPPADWTPSGHPGVKSRPSPSSTCQWTDGCADRPGRQTPGTGQPPTSDDMMAGRRSNRTSRRGAALPGRQGPDRPRQPGIRAGPGHPDGAGGPGSPKRQTRMAGRHRHIRTQTYSMKCRKMAGMKGPARGTLKNGRPPQAEIARTVVEPGGGPHVLALPSRTRAADHNTPGRPIAVTGIWKRACGGTRQKEEQSRRL